MQRQQPPAKFYRGEAVRVRTEAEIAATLDAEGKLEGLPFMEEMARFCGQAFLVYRRAGKTCVEGGYKLRRLKSTVLLEGSRCDGAFHNGCQRNCNYFWKEAWLEPADPVSLPKGDPIRPDASKPSSTWASQLPAKADKKFICQSTELLGATQPLSRWNLTHFFTEIREGELTIPNFITILSSTALDRVNRSFGNRPLGSVTGTKEDPTRGNLDLKAGEWVEVKAFEEIKRTLDSEGKNFGLSFESEMLNYVGRRFQVDFPIHKIILETNGQMIPLSHTVALKGVTCVAMCKKNCPRNNTLYWREAWLNRVAADK